MASVEKAKSWDFGTTNPRARPEQRRPVPLHGRSRSRRELRVDIGLSRLRLCRLARDIQDDMVVKEKEQHRRS